MYKCLKSQNYLAIIQNTQKCRRIVKTVFLKIKFSSYQKKHFIQIFSLLPALTIYLSYLPMILAEKLRRTYLVNIYESIVYNLKSSHSKLSIETLGSYFAIKIRLALIWWLFSKAKYCIHTFFILYLKQTIKRDSSLDQNANCTFVCFYDALTASPHRARSSLRKSRNLDHMPQCM